MKLEYHKLRASGHVPRVHPNGFVQLDLVKPGPATQRRLHIWPDTTKYKLKTQTTTHKIHDHRFDMHSKVILGALSDERYIFIPKVTTIVSTHELYIANYRTRHDTQLLSAGVFGVPRMTLQKFVRKGQDYQLAFGIFHDSVPMELPTATIMETSNPRNDVAVRVLIPMGVKPDNDFNRHTSNSESLLWEIIEEVCASL
jgi:hypothetical protein